MNWLAVKGYEGLYEVSGSQRQNKNLWRIYMEISITDTVHSLDKITQQQFNVAQINSIAIKHKELRNKSKAPTFALT